MKIDAEARTHADALLDFIDTSPTPWHAVAALEQRLRCATFTPLHEGEPWALTAGGRYYVTRGGSSIIFFSVAEDLNLPRAGFRIVGAHTDSPGLRVRPRASHLAGTLVRVGVEVYGSPILATFADRDLSLAGRITVRGVDGPESRLLRLDQPLLRLPTLAIHMNRAVNEEGLKFNKQTELPLILGEATAAEDPEFCLRSLLGAAAGCDPADLLAWDLCAYDTQKGACWGRHDELIASSRLDNLASCHAAASALLSASVSAGVSVCAFFDHEEVGSESHPGALGTFLATTLERIAAAAGLDRDAYVRSLARSLLISADMAHAFHPNFPGAYESQHPVRLNGGPVIKSNANQRYATDSTTAGLFIWLCDQLDVPHQHYSHRADIPCGSTIGPLTASRVGIPTLDVGSPLWSMHSIRESAGVLDHAWLTKVLAAFLSGEA